MTKKGKAPPGIKIPERPGIPLPEPEAAMMRGWFWFGIGGTFERHLKWVEKMRFRPKTSLERLALIASEVGEAANECRGDHPTKKLGEELADIILRVVDMAAVEGIDLPEVIRRKVSKNERTGSKGRKV